MATSALMAAMITWLSINFGLPAVSEHPRIEMVPAAQMAALRYRGLATGAPQGGPKSDDNPLDRGGSVIALYDDVRRTIYLPAGWTGASLPELSVLVHELVHHLQNVGGVTYECPQAREKPAYAAQRAWLAQYGLDLFEVFELDAFTMHLRTSCMQ
jgi:hypothetical protein